MKKLLIFLNLSFIIFTGCSNKSKMTFDEATGIVQKKYNKMVDTLITTVVEDREYIVAVLNDNNENYGPKLNSIVLLSSFAGNWQEEFNSKPDSYEGELPEIKNVSLSEIGNDYYVYFEEEDGDAFGNIGGGYISFNLLKITDHKTFSVGYSGFHPYQEMGEIENQLKSQLSCLPT